MLLKGNFTLYIWGSVGRCSVLIKSKNERKRKRPHQEVFFLSKRFKLNTKWWKWWSIHHPGYWPIYRPIWVPIPTFFPKWWPRRGRPLTIRHRLRSNIRFLFWSLRFPIQIDQRWYQFPKSYSEKHRIFCQNTFCLERKPFCSFLGASGTFMVHGFTDLFSFC